MALDGVRGQMPDTPANAAAFGGSRRRPDGQALEGGDPQFHVLLLAETGTPMVVEAYIKRGKHSEFSSGTALLRKASCGCLVLLDGGFYGYKPLAKAKQNGVRVLGRVGKHVIFKRSQVWCAGSYLTTIYRSLSEPY